MKYCPTCGAQLEDDARFCSNCGSKLPEESMPEQQTSAAVTEENAADESNVIENTQSEPADTEESVQPETPDTEESVQPETQDTDESAQTEAIQPEATEAKESVRPEPQKLEENTQTGSSGTPNGAAGNQNYNTTNGAAGNQNYNTTNGAAGNQNYSTPNGAAGNQYYNNSNGSAGNYNNGAQNGQPGNTYYGQPNNGPYNAYGNPQPKPPVNSKKILKILVPIIAAVAAIIAVVVYIRVSPAKIDVTKYAEIELDGEYNGYGTASVSFDSDSFERDLILALGKKGEISRDLYREFKESDDDIDLEYALEDLYEYGRAYDKVTRIEEALNYELDHDSGLSNGDTVELTFKYKNSKLKKYHIKFVGKQISMKVSDLEEVETFDAFKDINVSFYGSEPYGYAYFVDTDDFSYYDTENGLYYYIDEDENGNLSNGDKVDVYVSPDMYDSFDDYIEEYGRAPEKDSTQFTVSGLTKAVTSYSQLSDDAVDELKSQTTDNIKTESTGWSSDTSLDSYQYQGMYVVSPKEGSGYTTNMVFVVYEVTAKIDYEDYWDEDNNFTDTYTFYYYSEYDDVTLEDDGSISGTLPSAYEPSESAEYYNDNAGYSWYFDGYDSLSELQEAIEYDYASGYNIDSSFNT